MATLTSFTRPADPIDATQLSAQISSAVGIACTAEMRSLSEVWITGAITESERVAIQAAITAYAFSPLPLTYLTDAYMTNNPDMSANRANRLVTEHAAYGGDTTVAGLIGKIQTSSGIEYGAWPYPFTGTTNSSGVATVYLTSNGLTGGSAAFPTKVFNASAAPVGVGAANYNVTALTVSGDLKTLTITLNQLKNVLGLVTYNSTADAGVVVQGTIWGK